MKGCLTDTYPWICLRAVTGSTYVGIFDLSGQSMRCDDDLMPPPWTVGIIRIEFISTPNRPGKLYSVTGVDPLMRMPRPRVCPFHPVEA